jgi:uncharacterized coiled-coil DUF342 family protein
MSNRRSSELASESQSVGWISSTDAMLLFVAILTLVAMVFQQQWAAAESQLSDTERIRQSETSGLGAKLAISEAELKRLRDLIAGTGQDYATAITRIGELERILAEAFADIGELQKWLSQQMRRIDVLEGQVQDGRQRTERDAAEISKLGQLNSGLQRTLKLALAKVEEQSKELLAREMELQAQKAELARLAAKIAENEKQIATLTAAVNDYGTKVVKQTAEIETLKSQLAKCQAEVESLRTEVAVLMNEIALKSRELDRSQQEIRALVREIAMLKTTVDKGGLTVVRLNKENQELKATIDSLNMLIEQLRIRGRELLKENAGLRLRVAGQAGETDIRRELVGLQGPLGRVAILFDASESMAKGGRWESARKVVESWVANLSMRECRLIVFNSFIKPFPADGSVINLQGDDGDKKRRELVAFLAETKPEYQTNTRQALEEAYKTEGLDTIILFTDGAPTAGRSGVPSEAEAEEIYKLINRNPNIAINAVGIGAYFDPKLATFLLKVSELSNGSFMGR